MHPASSLARSLARARPPMQFLLAIRCNPTRGRIRTFQRALVLFRAAAVPFKKKLSVSFCANVCAHWQCCGQRRASGHGVYWQPRSTPRPYRSHSSHHSMPWILGCHMQSGVCVCVCSQKWGKTKKKRPPLQGKARSHVNGCWNDHGAKPGAAATGYRLLATGYWLLARRVVRVALPAGRDVRVLGHCRRRLEHVRQLAWRRRNKNKIK